MRAKIALWVVVAALSAGTAAAQKRDPRVPDTASVYCSGMYSREAMPRDTYLISGEESVQKIVFSMNDLVYVNKGSSQGVKVGDEFLVVRQEKDYTNADWFYWQPSLERAMGKYWADLGRLRVVHVGPDVATAQIVYACDLMYRGDLVLPYAERPAPMMNTDPIDRFAPASGKTTAMLVKAKNFRVMVSAGDIAYINAGSGQGVQVGDRLRIFRYQGTTHGTVYTHPGHQYRTFGFGRTPRPYKWSDVPREILGEALVLRVSENAATVLVTKSVREAFLGDYVEVQ
jgi:hypothetical protein